MNYIKLSMIQDLCSKIDIGNNYTTSKKYILSCHIMKYISTIEVSLADTKHAVMLNFDIAFNWHWFGLSKEVCNSFLAQLT